MHNNITAPDPTQRFANRAEDYKKHRPGYPEALAGILQKNGALPANAAVADIGAGTGLLTKILLPRARIVYGVEPNEAMRREAELEFAGVRNFISMDGAAEATGLPDHSIDLITAAQAFHWFDAEKARKEFRRILKPGGFVALIWNIRDTEVDDFQREYEHILHTHITDYKQIFSRTASAEHIYDFFDPSKVHIFQFANEQSFDLTALKGRLMSSSYAPKPPDPVFDILMQEVEKLFERRRRDGRVRFIYKTNLYLGQLKEHSDGRQ